MLTPQDYYKLLCTRSRNHGDWKEPWDTTSPNCYSKWGSKLNTDQVAQAFVQSGLEKFQGWRLHSPSGLLLQSLIARTAITFFFISHLDASISTSAWSKTGRSIPGSHERHVNGQHHLPSVC